MTAVRALGTLCLLLASCDRGVGSVAPAATPPCSELSDAPASKTHDVPAHLSDVLEGPFEDPEAVVASRVEPLPEDCGEPDDESPRTQTRTTARSEHESFELVEDRPSVAEYTAVRLSHVRQYVEVQGNRKAEWSEITEPVTTRCEATADGRVHCQARAAGRSW